VAGGALGPRHIPDLWSTRNAAGFAPATNEHAVFIQRMQIPFVALEMHSQLLEFNSSVTSAMLHDAEARSSR